MYCLEQKKLKITLLLLKTAQNDVRFVTKPFNSQA